MELVIEAFYLLKKRLEFFKLIDMDTIIVWRRVEKRVICFSNCGAIIGLGKERKIFKTCKIR